MNGYRLIVWYAASDEDSPQVESGLTIEQVEQGLGAFLRDMESLEGRGCRKVAVEVQG